MDGEAVSGVRRPWTSRRVFAISFAVHGLISCGVYGLALGAAFDPDGAAASSERAFSFLLGVTKLLSLPLSLVFDLDTTSVFVAPVVVLLPSSLIWAALITFVRSRRRGGAPKASPL